MSVDVTGTTKITGIFGCPVEHTLSPRMHNAAFQALGLDMVYVPFEVKGGALKEAIGAIRTLNLLGMNLTYPHKIAAMDFLDVVNDEAKEIGAVNTVVNREGRLLGSNTDGRGFVRSLREDYGFEPRGKRAIVFGAGGAARAICWALRQEMPERLVIVNRTFERAEALAGQVGGRAVPWNDPKLHKEISKAHLVVNATPSSLRLDLAWLPEEVFLYDIVYSRKESGCMREAKKKGARMGNGLSMLLFQGALAFELWTGEKAPLNVMRQALGGA